MSDDNPNTKTFSNHTIELNPHNWEFTVSGPEFDDSKYKIAFASYKDARDEIQKRVNESQRAAAKNVVLHLNVLDSDGKACAIERVNRATGEVTGVSTGEFFPDLPWLREALQRRVRIRAEMREIDQAVKPFHTSKTVGWGGRINPENYAVVVERLKADFLSKTQAAREVAQPSLAHNSETTTQVTSNN